MGGAHFPHEGQETSPNIDHQKQSEQKTPGAPAGSEDIAKPGPGDQAQM